MVQQPLLKGLLPRRKPLMKGLCPIKLNEPRKWTSPLGTACPFQMTCPPQRTAWTAETAGTSKKDGVKHPSWNLGLAGWKWSRRRRQQEKLLPKRNPRRKPAAAAAAPQNQQQWTHPLVKGKNQHPNPLIKGNCLRYCHRPPQCAGGQRGTSTPRASGPWRGSSRWATKCTWCLSVAKSDGEKPTVRHWVLGMAGSP